MVPRDELEHGSGASRVARFLPSLLAGGALLGLLAYGVLRPGPAAEIEPGAPAPGFELPRVTAAGDLEGTLSDDDLEGSVVVLNFWWSGCDPCREEAPLLDAVWRKHRADGLVVVGVDVERDTPAAAADFAKAFGMSYPIVRDVEGELADAYRINDRFLPQTFFIDRDGTIAPLAVGKVLTDARGSAYLGALTRPVLEKQVAALLD
ncbi:MAG: TlpA family protein disulfide reductase [Actinomycetota bacterium]